MSHKRRHLQPVLDGLGSYEFSATGLDEVFFSVGNAEEAVGVDVADVAGFEPVIFKSLGRLFRIVPVALENRRAAYQQFAVFGDATFEIRQRLAHSSELIRHRIIHCYYWRGLTETITVKNADAHVTVSAPKIA